ncbi:MAG: helix-turn-helix transcriptional regulator [Tessaracoccus sp.]|uniref:helix-turn-helix transcriptional regulator n=1 Tax=Tessaracoccus sp. TaxID=1971211 RepID=UPI001ECDDEC8|nr:helix-turn-helix transcriptional regulator [Tessaracoccus sp.]MBK7821072.1 helix-turn-helix transcriptional regulator [Tessaracoccus sp.]
METTDVQDWISHGCAAEQGNGPVDFSVSITIGSVAGTVLAGTVLLDEEHEAATLDDLQRAADAIVRAASDTLGQSSTTPLIRPEVGAALDVEALAVHLRHRDVVANLELLNDYLDRLLPRWSQKVSREALAPFERALTELAASDGPRCARSMASAIAGKREFRRAAMNRYECQVHCERLLLRLHDLLEPAESERRPTMTTLLNEIERDPTAFLTVGKAAAHLALSESYFARQFKQHTGENYIPYITRKRVERAKLLLTHTERPVLRIATELDFQPVNYFSRTFKKYVGLTPSQYRQKFARDAA